MSAGGSHESPYPGMSAAGGDDDPRPYWARTWQREVNRRFEGIEKTVETIDGKVDLLLDDKSKRDGVAVTWKGLAIGIGAFVGVSTIIGLLVAVLQSLPGGT